MGRYFYFSQSCVIETETPKMLKKPHRISKKFLGFLRTVQLMAGKQPKKTPNLEWGSMDKGLSLLKTSLSKKLGGKERNDIPQSFLAQVDRVKQLHKLLEALISQAKHCTKSYIGALVLRMRKEKKSIRGTLCIPCIPHTITFSC